jgi:hypothetical protein
VDAVCTEMVQDRVQLLVIVRVYTYIKKERKEKKKEKGESKVREGRLPFTDQRYLYVPSALPLRSSAFCPHAVYLCIWYGSYNKQRLLP